MSWKIAGLILLLCASIGLAEDGPTILAPRPITPTPSPATSGQENVETLPTPRLAITGVSPVESPPKLKEVPNSRPPAPSGAERGGKAFVPPDISRLLQETAVLKVEREKLQTEHDEMTQPMERADASHAGDIIKLRLRLAQLLTKLGTQGKAEESKEPAKTVPGPGRPARTSNSERATSIGPDPPKQRQTEQH